MRPTPYLFGMRRREFVAAGGASLLAAVAGCADLDAVLRLGDDDRHPFAGSTVTVRIENRSTTDHDVERNARETLAFWEAESTTYAGFDVTFELVESDPQLILRYADDPSGCEDVDGFDENSVLGCAPLIRPGNRPPEPTVARIVAGSRPFGQIRTTAKHEVGHVLGLDHADEPREVMSNRPEDRIPLYSLRVEIWESVLEGWELSASAARTFSDGGDAWNDETYGAAASLYDEASEGFAAARERFVRNRARTDEFEGDDRAETVDLPGLRAHLDRLVGRMASGVEFASLMAEAARFRADGDVESTNDRIRRANAAIESFNEPPRLEPRDVAVALGLVRGFDREDEPVTVDGEVG